MSVTHQPARRGRKPSPKFSTEGQKVTLTMNRSNIEYLKSLAERQKANHYSWALDDILTALRTEDQELLDRVLNPSS